jgi:hypothetical protein
MELAETPVGIGTPLLKDLAGAKVGRTVVLFILAIAIIVQAGGKH